MKRQPLPSRLFVEAIANDAKRRTGKEREARSRLSKALLSDKIEDTNFCLNIWPKLVDNHASLVEENSALFMADLKKTEVLP